MQIADEKNFTYSPVEWRFSGVTPSFFGIDPIVVLAGPALFLGLSRQYSLLYFVALFLFVALCVYVSVFTRNRSVLEWVHAMRTRYLQRRQWETE